MMIEEFFERIYRPFWINTVSCLCKTDNGSISGTSVTMANELKLKKNAVRINTDLKAIRFG